MCKACNEWFHVSLQVIVWFSFVHLAIHIAILFGLGRVVFPLIQRVWAPSLSAIAQNNDHQCAMNPILLSILRAETLAGSWQSRNSGTKAGFSESFWWNELLLASNANVGGRHTQRRDRTRECAEFGEARGRQPCLTRLVAGPTTAAGMAAAKKWRALVVPALLVHPGTCLSAHAWNGQGRLTAWSMRGCTGWSFWLCNRDLSFDSPRSVRFGAANGALRAGLPDNRHPQNLL